MTSLESLKSQTASWTVDLTSRQVVRSANHDLFYGYQENLPYWNIEAFMTHIHPGDVDGFGERFKQAGIKREAFEIEFTAVWNDGRLVRLRSEGNVVREPNGSIIVIGTTRLCD